VTARARLPLLGEASTPRRDAVSAPAARVEVERRVIGVHDRSAPEPALRFAEALIAALHRAGREVAALVAVDAGRAREGDLRRLRAAGAAPALALDEPALPGVAQRAIAALPDDCIVIALGAAFVAQLATSLAVRVSTSPAASLRDSRDAQAFDLEIGAGMEGSATLIGDWLAQRVA
jgi:hypothetical protein